MGVINQFKHGGGGFIGESTSSGGTSGTLATQGLYSRPAASNEGLNAGTRSVANGLAYNRSVQPEGLVENRLVNLLAQDSPYMRQATQEGLRHAQNRGLLNSSIAAGESRAAAIRAGMPIAAADANSINSAEEQNVGVLNQNHMQERQLMNEATIAEANRQSAAGAFEAGQREAAQERAWRTQMQREQYGFEGEQRELDRMHNFGIMDRDYSWRDQISDNDAFREDWLGSNRFDREFYGSMATMFAGAQINNTSDFFGMLNEYQLENPDIFSQEDYMAAGDFFSQNMGIWMQNAFRGILGG